MNQNNTGKSDEFISSDDFFKCWPIYTSVILFFVVEIIFILIILFYYKKKRSFLKWTLYVVCFFLNILNHIIFVPVCSLLNLFLLLIIIYNSIFACNSIYLSRSIDSCWDPKIKSIFTISIGISALLGTCLNIFARWTAFIGLFLSIFLYIYQLYLLYYLPYIKEFMNIVIQSTCILSIINAIITCFQYNKNVSIIVHIIVPVVFFVIFCVLYFYFDKYKIKKVLQRLKK